MKFNITIFTAVFAVALVSSAAFAMGGPAVEIHKNNTTVVQSQTAEAHAAAVSGGAAISEAEKAKDVLASLEVQSEVYNSYLMVLNRKILEAKRAGDTEKSDELSAMERAMSEQESNVVLKITAIIQEHPELKPAEKPSVEATGKIEKPEQAELKPSGKPAVEAAKKAEKPKQANKPKPASHNIVYYVVKKGDTLKSIARKCMGSESFYKEIARLNGITKARQFKPGIRLKIYKLNAK